MSTQCVAFFTQGCRLNQAETAMLEQQFQRQGFRVVEPTEPADVVVVNTCTVTEKSDTDTRRLVNRLTRLNPATKIALIGCQSQVHKEALLALKNVHWVIGNGSKMALSDIILETYDQVDPVVMTPKMDKTSFTMSDVGVDRRHIRANLKIQDGCDFFCAFCVIPFARGPARSREFDNILTEAKQLVAANHKEVILTGINVGTYSDKGKTIADVVGQLAQIQGLERIRISSIEPTTIPSSIIDMMASSPSLCPYFHIPIQSGSDEILALMKRHYTVTEFTHFLESILKKIPDACIGTDVMVGFPGETEALFEETVNTCREAPFSYFHVFSYSERKFARSTRFSDKVPVAIIKKRSQILRELSHRKQFTYNCRFLGTTQPVLFEQEKHGLWTGLTPHFVRVYVSSQVSLKNQICEVQLEKVQDNGIIGRLVG